MSRAHMSLLLLLGLQVLITVGLYVNKNYRDDTPKPQALLSFDVQAVDRIEIMTPDSKLQLIKVNQKWRNPEQASLPLNTSLIQTALNDLAQ